MGYAGVSFVCVFCSRLCGWDAKRNLWDGVQMENPPREGWLQYVHPDCIGTSARDPKGGVDSLVEQMFSEVERRTGSPVDHG